MSLRFALPMGLDCYMYIYTVRVSDEMTTVVLSEMVDDSKKKMVLL